MRFVLILFVLFIFKTNEVFSQVKVKGYFRKDGTYVRPHYKSYPDGNIQNNWSFKCDINRK